MTDREGVFPMQPGIYISSPPALKDDKGKDLDTNPIVVTARKRPASSGAFSISGICPRS